MSTIVDPATTPKAPKSPAKVRPAWRSVAIPNEHGGWGLTAEPILLGLLIAFSWAGLAIGVAALLAFLVRTPLKLAAMDFRRGRRLERTGLARRLAITELALIVALASSALVAAGPSWLVPVAIACPLIGLELWFDVRNRGRRLIPELAGSVGIASVGASIVIAGDGGATLAAGVWLVLGARAIASIPFVRTQIERLRRGTAQLTVADVCQVVGLGVAAVAVLIDTTVWLGSVAVALVIVGQYASLRRSPVPPAKVNGIRQMVFGFAIVAATAVGVLIA